MLHLDLQRAKELVAESIAAKGADYEYPKQGGTCLYVHDVHDTWDDVQDDYVNTFEDAVPGCLVGDALKRGGIPLEVMGSKYNNDTSSDELLKKLQEGGWLTYTDSASAYLGNAQASQDNGAPWGMAASAAAVGDQLEKKFEWTDSTGQGEWTGEFKQVPGLMVE